MIKLSEIVHTIRKDKDELENDLTALENWRIVDSDFLTDMGFQPAGITHFEMKNPNIVVYHQKNKGFVVDGRILCASSYRMFHLMIRQSKLFRFENIH